ncbi:MAG: hypothetical protein FVQ80_03685 [Planctomycetes bacterium]|nr:hypothetical protein [Planctomycetota bacterium]
MEWENYIVGIVDILGQSQKLKELGSLLDQDSLEKDNCKSIVKKLTDETYGEVGHFRELFTKTFDLMKKNIHEHPKMKTLLPTEREMLNEIADDICKLRFFSDLVVCYIPCGINELVTRTRLATMLATYTGVLILEFRAGTFFRGGIEMGAGTELNDGDIYGPVLNEAHYLENDIADYPRIIVGKKLSDFIQSDTQVPNDGEFLRSMFASVNNLSKGMVCRDDDGHIIIDYLGESAAKLHRFEGSEACSFVKKSIAKIESELERYNKEGNHKLEKRYEKLLTYCQSRMEFWDN